MISATRRALSPLVTEVVFNTGHTSHPLIGPYPESVRKKMNMFECLNTYRIASNLFPWKLTPKSGEALTGYLEQKNSEEARKTIVVMPAGPSSKLDAVFKKDQTDSLLRFFEKGGLGYFNCGSAYWVSRERIYNDVCELQPEVRRPIIKGTNLPLFQGTTEGPLCPFPGERYKVGFFSDAVGIHDGKKTYTIFLSGGGSFMTEEAIKSGQKVAVLARYLHSELVRVGKQIDECKKWENAVIMASVGKGAVLLSSVHSEYDPRSIDPTLYEATFPNSGTNWRSVKERLSSLDDRMRFELKLLSRLESQDFEQEGVI